MTSPAGPSPMPPGPTRRVDARTMRRRRAALAGVVALLALGGGLAVGAAGGDGAEALAERYVAAWGRGDWSAMHAMLDDGGRRQLSRGALQRAYAQAAETATLTGVKVTGDLQRDGDLMRVPVTASTRLFGPVRAELQVPLGPVGGEPDAGIHPDGRLLFPGLRSGETLRRTGRMGARGDILARDGTPLAAGEDRSSQLGPLAAEVAGRVGAAPAGRARALRALGVPADATVGVSGAELEFDETLRGTPGGMLLAGDRPLARHTATAGTDVRTSISPTVQTAAVEALAGRLGGIAAVDPSTGEVLALSGISGSSPQPPGSVFKIITLAAALQARTVRRDETFPVRTEAVLEGVSLENAHGEACGGGLLRAFAESCNSVFAPIGAELGAARLVSAAERFGFNSPPPISGTARSSIPRAQDIGDALAVGSSAIGQGRVLATPLQMVDVAATIAEDGQRRRLSMRLGGATEPPKRVIPAPIAAVVTSAMRRAIADGTGSAAAITGVDVAGKTGTAELRSPDAAQPATGADGQPGATVDDPTDTDAWFVAFAPAVNPRIAVAVMLVGQGAGGVTAAPAARQVLVAGLEAATRR